MFFILFVLVVFIVGVGISSWAEERADNRVKARAAEWLEAEKQRPMCALKVTFVDGTDVISDPIPPLAQIGDLNTFYPSTSKAYAESMAHSILSGSGILRIRGKRWPTSSIKVIEVVPAVSQAK